MFTVRLKAKRDRPTRFGHPWIFSGAVESVDGTPARGETVTVTNNKGTVLGRGAWSPDSQIRIRMWTFDADTEVDEAFFERRLRQALAVRDGMEIRFATNALRLVNAEADGFPGLTVDRFGSVLVGQFTTAGAEFHKQTLVRLLMTLTGATAFYERSDVDSRRREGLEETTGLLAGNLPVEPIIITENGIRFEIDIKSGHKTGFYLDQRENRRIIASYANGLDVLNTFSYTGGFGIAAQSAGAKTVTHVDLSAPALEIAKRNSAMNAGDCSSVGFVQGNVFSELRALRDRARSFGLVVLDPPKFAETRSQTNKALRGYKDVNLIGIRLVKPGGLLATFSCSGAIDPALFRTVVAEAAHDAGREVRILHELRQAPDHTEALTFPEGLYLKGLLCRVL